MRYKTFELKKADGEDSLTMENVLLKELSSAKILRFSDIFRRVPNLEAKDGRTVLGLLKLMHSRVSIRLDIFMIDEVSTFYPDWKQFTNLDFVSNRAALRNLMVHTKVF